MTQNGDKNWRVFVEGTYMAIMEAAENALGMDK
jgi:hypothetical protein